jgi:hypothetical protein
VTVEEAIKSSLVSEGWADDSALTLMPMRLAALCFLLEVDPVFRTTPIFAKRPTPT